MSGYKRGRGVKGNLALTIVTAVLACGVIVTAVWLFKKFPTASYVASSSKATSSQTTSSSTVSSSQLASSSQVASSSQAASSQTASSGTVSPDYFKGAVFVGDSLTEGLSLYGEMDKATVIGETGLSAYTSVAHSFLINGKTEKISAAAAALSPDKIYILLGSNDIAEGYSVTGFIKYYGQLIDAIKAKCPNAKIYVQSIFPVTSSYETKKQKSGGYVTNAKILEYNAALNTMCSGKNVTYLDVASVLKGPDGKLPSSASDDGLHLRKAYYDKWFAYLGTH